MELCKDERPKGRGGCYIARRLVELDATRASQVRLGGARRGWVMAREI